MQQGILTPFQLITEIGVIELFLNATLCERALCETFVREASGTESDKYLPILVCRMLRVQTPV